MFSKIRNAALALAAVATLGAAALVTSTDSADARGFGGGFNRGGGMARASVARNVGVRNIGARNLRIRTVNRGPRFVGRHVRPNWCRYGRCGVHVRWHRPWIYGVGAVAATTYAVAPVAVAAAPAGRCTCLTKEYTPDNLVVFQDVCTKEVASAPIGNTQVQIQVPQQQQPQPQ